MFRVRYQQVTWLVLKTVHEGASLISSPLLGRCLGGKLGLIPVLNLASPPLVLQLIHEADKHQPKSTGHHNGDGDNQGSLVCDLSAHPSLSCNPLQGTHISEHNG